MYGFRKDKTKLCDIIKSIEKVQAAIVVMKFEDFIKGIEPRRENHFLAVEIGGKERQLNEEFKLSYRNIDRNFLQNL